MSTFISQTLSIGGVPVGFDLVPLNKDPLKRPKRAFGIVEGNDIRVAADELPTANSGLLATLGSSITITGEADIEAFRAISTSLTNTAWVFFEFSDNE